MDIDKLDDLNIDDELGLDEEGLDPNYDLGYQIGYDTGYIEGYEEGQITLAFDKQVAIYNEALSEIISQVDKFDFDQKGDLIMVLELLRRA